MVLDIGSVESLAAADLDGDGDVDVLAANTSFPRVMVLENDGLGGLTPGRTFTAGERVGGLVAQDLNGDGLVDLAVGCYEAVWLFFAVADYRLEIRSGFQALPAARPKEHGPISDRDAWPWMNEEAPPGS